MGGPAQCGALHILYATLPSSSPVTLSAFCLSVQVLPLMQANLEANGFDPAKG